MSNSNQQKGISEIAAKDYLDTHGSGEPSADNVDISGNEWKNS